MKCKTLIVFLLGCIFWVPSPAQNDPEALLADRYFEEENFEAALELYEKVYRKQETEPVADRIVDCFVALDRYDDGLKFLDKAIRKTENPIFLAQKGVLLEKTGEIKAADKVYDDLIEKRLAYYGDFVKVGSFFYQEGKLDQAAATYEQARKTLGNPLLFGVELANIYRQQGQYRQATIELLNTYYENPVNLTTSRMEILNMVKPSSEQEIEKALLQAVDREPNDLGLRSLLFEYYVLAEDFFEAFIQVKSIDRLFKEDGARVFQFGETMRNNREYSLSNEAFDYIIEKKKYSPYFYRAYLEKAVNGELQAFEKVPVDQAAVRQAVEDYGQLLKEFGYKPQYFNAIYRRARLMVFYLNEEALARSELEEVLRQKQQLRLDEWAQGMLLIGDIQLIQRDYNKAKLTYTEVSETFRDRQLGAKAKYKLGQLAYYKGEFKLAQALLGAIKDNTSNDISNDAIKLNLIILDNTGLDTTTTALERFAEAQLLVYQRDYSGAMAILDSLAGTFPGHSLADEILWEKANIFLKQNDVQTALNYIDRLLREFPEDIHGDDALYTKARIHDYTLNDPDTAMELYLKFLSTYPGSLYSVEVRKRIRELRQAG